MEVSGHFYDSDALPLKKEPPVPTGYKAWAPELVWTLWRREKFPALPIVQPVP
jgi:hypothetical protein